MSARAVLRDSYQAGFVDGVTLALKAAIGERDDSLIEMDAYDGPPLPDAFVAWAREKLAVAAGDGS